MVARTARTAHPAAPLPPAPPDDAIPDNLIIAACVGEVGAAGVWIGTLGDLLREMWVVATRLGHYPGTALFAASDERLYAVEGCVFGRPTGPAEGPVACPGRLRAPAPSHRRTAAPLDSLVVADLICPGTFSPTAVRTVGELKREIWRKLVETFEGVPPVRSVAFIETDGRRYVAEFGLRVRLACAERDRAAIEWERGFLRDEAAERVEELDGCLRRLEG